MSSGSVHVTPGSRVRERFNSKKPSVPATPSTPSHRTTAASPRRPGDHRTEERHPFHTDDRGSDLMADLVRAQMVGYLDCLVECFAVRGIGQARGKPGSRRRLFGRYPFPRLALKMEAIAQFGVQQQQEVVPAGPLSGDADPDRPP